MDYILNCSNTDFNFQIALSMKEQKLNEIRAYYEIEMAGVNTRYSTLYDSLQCMYMYDAVLYRSFLLDG